MLKIGARGSNLSRVQAETVGSLMQKYGYDVEYRWISSFGDMDQKSPLSSFGEGIFVNTINEELLRGGIDIAVHSGKDIPGTYSNDLEVAYVSQRGDPRDTLVSSSSIHETPKGGKVGTSSSRRRMQLQDLRQDLVFSEIRGNIETRISKIGSEFHGVVLAKVALDRLKIRIENYPFSYQEMVPAPNQGFIVAMCRRGESPDLTAIDRESREVFNMERFCMNYLGFGCSQPLGIIVERRGRGFMLSIRHYKENGIRDIDDKIGFSDQDDLLSILSNYREII